MKRKKKSTAHEVWVSFVYAVKYVFRYFRGELIYDLISTVCGRVIVFFSNAYMLRYIVNGIQTGKSVYSLLTYTAVIICLNIIYESVNKYFSKIWCPIAQMKGEAKICKALYQKSVEADIVCYEKPDSYALFDRVLSNTVPALGRALGLLVNWFSIITSVSLSSWLIFTIDPWLIVFALPPVFVNLYYGKLIQKRHDYDSRIREINRKKGYAKRAFYLRDYAKELRLSNIGRVLIRQFTESTQEYTQAVKTEGRKVHLGYYFVNNLAVIIPQYAAQIYCLYHTLVTRTIYIGDCLVILTSITAIVNPVKGMANSYATMKDISLKMADLRSFLDTKPSIGQIPNGRTAQKGDIEFSDVCFAYEGSRNNALNHVSIKIPAGKTVAIVGKNGAGKTTLVKLLMRLYDVSAGAVSLGGHNIKEYDLRDYRDKIGVVMQDCKPMALSVAENILGRPYREEDEPIVSDALEKVGLLEKINSTKHGIHTVLTKEFTSDGLILSGGEQQKLAIASIYAKNCNTVILDEPSSALDPLAEREMYETMRSVCRDKTLIFISHRLSATVDADKIFLMDDGMIREEGTHAELMKTGGLYSEMFKLQSQNYTDGIIR